MKLFIVRMMYRLHLFGAFLKVYCYMIKHFKKDIKW